MHRRAFVASVAGLAVAGCIGSSGSDSVPDDADVVAGPGGRNIFDPDEITVESGETVTWYFDSPGHNVSCDPGDSDAAELPDGADSFASYGEGSPNEFVAAGETCERRFETPGRYEYVCVPHVSANMIGTVVVEE